ncbi:NUDIX hydrolase [Tenacibaculum jejuense]|uniref:Hydrolase, NUDIX family protein n=1 Tax=Tenacibaculum jejuense TaxID=584609 RepID=A0A238UB62_9FLAO|nr:CoA pyrophosphatase [Tenacibaculum jejuense]SNR16409.1 Hydrolase, NUDIX family protein [Tenacibaculum jejuense]
MDFTYFKNQINAIKNNDLGGTTSQFKLVPEIRIKISEETIKKNNPRKAAVLCLFYPDSEGKTVFLLTKRASYKGTHSAQISFPGGKADEEDKTFADTALRELEEEVGVDRNSVQLIRQISDTYIPPSNFMVTPFIGYLNKKPNYVTNKEVAEIIEVQLDDLLDDSKISSVELDTSYMKKIAVPCFLLNEQVVWGATAMILSEIKDLIKES